MSDKYYDSTPLAQRHWWLPSTVCLNIKWKNNKQNDGQQLLFVSVLLSRRNLTTSLKRLIIHLKESTKGTHDKTNLLNKSREVLFRAWIQSLHGLKCAFIYIQKTHHTAAHWGDLPMLNGLLVTVMRPQHCHLCLKEIALLLPISSTPSRHA